jgi:predicted deacylase
MEAGDVGGNHGDEYEGPVALLNLARELEPESVSGRIVIIPALNYPAVEAGTRLSPIDGRNMNRTFPGRWDGSVTEMIAHFVQNEILPGVDAVIDMHSGG